MRSKQGRGRCDEGGNMKPPAPAWDAVYSHDRRAHRHRCRCCSGLLNEGDAAVMTRVEGGKTRAIHAGCAGKRFGSSAFTWRDAMVTWGSAYLRGCGWKIEKTPLELA
jgi:hypothetical protein